MCKLKDWECKNSSFFVLSNFSLCFSGPPLQVEINMQVRSMGPISEIDMVRWVFWIWFQKVLWMKSKGWPLEQEIFLDFLSSIHWKLHILSEIVHQNVVKTFPRSWLCSTKDSQFIKEILIWSTELVLSNNSHVPSIDKIILYNLQYINLQLWLL